MFIGGFMNTTLITPVILAGGIGTRLWPLSRQAMPKQFLPLLDNKHSLLQSTLARVSGEGFAKPILVCNEQHRFIAAEQSAQAAPHALALISAPGSDSLGTFVNV